MTKREKILTAIAVVLILVAIGFTLKQTPAKLGQVYGQPSNVNSYVTASTTATVANYPVILHTVTLGSIAGTVVTIYNTASSTLATTSNIMAVLTEGTTTQTLLFDGAFNSGLTIKQSATSSLTVTYQQN